MKAILTILLVLLLLAQIRLWHDVREIRGLSSLVEQQLEENRRLDSRNEALAAEVDDLRAGLQAIEERARSELGLIREGEEFFIVVDPEAIDPERLEDGAEADPNSPLDNDVPP